MTEPSELLFVLDTGSVKSIFTSVSIDQGCPGSVVAFALGMQRAMCRMHTRLSELRVGMGLDAAAPFEFLSYLDDLTVVLDSALAPHMMPVITEELQRLGLEVNLDKSTCFGGRPHCPDGHALLGLWERTREQGGIICVGAPFGGRDADEDDFDLHTAAPIGTPTFV